MTILDELYQQIDPNAQYDCKIFSRCICGLIQYAAELRQSHSPYGRAKTGELRDLLYELSEYCGLDEDRRCPNLDQWQRAFDMTMAAADAAGKPWETPLRCKADAVLGLYHHAMDAASGMGADAKPLIIRDQYLIREIEVFWDYGSPVLDRLCENITSALFQLEVQTAVPSLEMTGL